MTLCLQIVVNRLQLQHPQAMNAEVIGGYARFVLNQAEAGNHHLSNEYLEWYGASVESKELSV